VVHDHGDTFDFTLTEEAQDELHGAMALAWRDICAEHRTTRVATPIGARRAIRRGAPRPRARRARRRTATSRAGPGDDSGESEPPGLAPGGAPLAVRTHRARRAYLIAGQVAQLEQERPR
jgi:hypothetical protein